MENEKPNWLERLEQESWQAELIVSGAAIYGSFQLTGLLNDMVEYCLVQIPQSIHFGLYILFLYLFLAVNALIVCLIVHFIMRTLWIGLIGLNSVFPKGINPDFKSYPRHFMEKLLVDYPHDIRHITDLDNFCSAIFAFCASLVLSFLAITINVVVLLFLYYHLIGILPEGSGGTILLVFGSTFLLASLAVMVLNQKKLRETEFAKKYQYPLHKWLGILTLHIFRKPVTKLSFTFFSNLDMKKYMALVSGIFTICMVLFFFQLLDGKLVYLFNKGLFNADSNRTDRMMPEQYENLRNEKNGRILTALLESDKITGSTLQVFVPTFNNEDEELQKCCGEMPKNESEDRDSLRQISRQYWLDCYRNCHKFYLNDRHVGASVIKFTHPNRGEHGIRAIIKTESLDDGLHVLKVEKLGAEKGAFRTMQVPFWFEKKAAPSSDVQQTGSE